MSQIKTRVLFILGGISVIGTLFLIIGYESTWQVWNIPVITWRDLGQIFEATQKGTAISYGINLVGMYPTWRITRSLSEIIGEMIVAQRAVLQPI